MALRSISANGAQLLGNFTDWTYVMIQNPGPGSIRISNDQTELQANQSSGGVLPGWEIDQTAPFLGWWLGQLWAVGNQANGQAINFFSLTAPPQSYFQKLTGNISI